MLDRDVNNDNIHPIVVDYITENNYYEIKVVGMALKQFRFNTNETISMMIDSGTTFSHFPKRYMSNILRYLNRYC
jgi:hypothetical protein